jgi:SSS family solute:Na+ symporter
LANVAGTDRADYNTMLPTLIKYLIPVGLRGLIAASLAAALMSCMAAALNSCATLISMDVLKRIHPDATDARLVRVGRIATGVVMVLAMLWSTQGNQFGNIFEAVNKIPMTFAPGVTTVFLFGVLWKRGTWQAAMATLYLGTLLGIVYFIADLPAIGNWFLPASELNNFGGFVTDPTHGLGIPFMLAGPIIAVACVAIYVTTSFMTPAMNQAEVAKVCWDHPLSFLMGPVTGASDPRIVSVVLTATVWALYYFLR